MKRITLSKIALVAVALGLSSVAFADSNELRRDSQSGSAPARHTTQSSLRTARGTEEVDEGVNPIVDSATFPFRMLGRGGMTVVRSPMIVGETLKGDRTFISGRGLFMKTEPASPPTTGNLTEPQRSIPMGRGERMSIGTGTGE